MVLDFNNGAIKMANVNGTPGDDILTSTADDDTLVGGLGTDHYVFSGDFGKDLIFDLDFLSNDVIEIHGVTAADIRLATNEDSTLEIHVDGAGADGLIEVAYPLPYMPVSHILLDDGTTIDLTGALTLTGTAENEIMLGTRFDDVISTKGGIDIIYAGQGNDIVRGGGGDDFLQGDTPSDAVSLHGDDKLYGGAGNDTAFGYGGSDLIIGGKGDDYLDGGFGRDKIKGGSGDDTLIGGHGNDVLTGGSGSDNFVFNNNSGRDVIRDFTSGEDTLDFKTVGSLAETSFSQIHGGQDLLIDLNGIEVVLKNTALSDIDPALDFLFL